MADKLKFRLELKRPLVVELDRDDDALVEYLRDEHDTTVADATTDELHDAFVQLAEDDPDLILGNLSPDDFDVHLGEP